MSEIELKIDGMSYQGWQELTVVRTIEGLAGRFEIKMTDKDEIPVPRGGALELLMEGETVILGYSDTITKDLNESENSLMITGRDKTADLIDCSALVKSQELLNVTLRQIIEEVIEPFGIKAIFDIEPSERFRKFSFEEETGFEAIERACRLRGVIATSNRKGQLIIQNPGQKRSSTGLSLGENVLSIQTTLNDTDRFSEYLVYGQQSGSDDIAPISSVNPKGRATDQTIKRYRPLIVLAEGEVSTAIAQERAEWEAAIRASRSENIVVILPEWTQEDGTLWKENELVRCNLGSAGVTGDMLIKEISFTLSDKRGRKTKLSLVRPDSYIKQPDIKESEVNLDE